CSIFRLLVGATLVADGTYNVPSWGRGNEASKEVRSGEIALEREVSGIIGAMPFLWLRVDDEPRAESMRGYIERNSIALLSNFKRPPLDPASDNWLGLRSDRERVRQSGLWNSNHVDERYDPAFLSCLEELIAAAGRPP
ncbi:MAG TPA: hypothetical protein VE650_10595, partial [Acetobacteraceae bacterium]|nr:hypothetical protein [Acetobacteraceae bacterium]